MEWQCLWPRATENMGQMPPSIPNQDTLTIHYEHLYLPNQLCNMYVLFSLFTYCSSNHVLLNTAGMMNYHDLNITPINILNITKVI